MSGPDSFAPSREPNPDAPIADQVRAILADVLCRDPSELVDEARLAQDLAADSLDWLTIASDFEDAFALSCNDLIDGPQPATVADCVTLVRSKIEGR